MKIDSLFRWLLPAAYPGTTPNVSSPAPGNQARIWFYREASRYDGGGTPYLRLNGTVGGVSQPSAAFLSTFRPATIT